jgi:preprotein translocase subunit Sec61beta
MVVYVGMVVHDCKVPYVQIQPGMVVYAGLYMVVKYNMFRSSLEWLYMLGCMMVVYGCEVPYVQIQPGMVVYAGLYDGCIWL